MNVKSRILIAAVALTVVSCGTPTDDAGGSATTTEALVTTTTEDAVTTTGAPATTLETPLLDEAKLIQTAIRDLAGRLEADEESIEVVESRSVEWPDGSIGCPEDSLSYTQAIVDGVQVLLSSDGKIYDYHAGLDGEIFLCASDEKDGGYDFVPPPGFNG